MTCKGYIAILLRRDRESISDIAKSPLSCPSGNMAGDNQTDLPINFFIFKPKRSVTRKRSYRFDELEYVDAGGIYSFDREIAKTFFLPPGEAAKNI